MEITRKRTRESLEQILCEACPTCQGRGTVKTIQTVCYEILREILREDRQYKAQSYTIVAAPAVVELLLDEEANSLADLQEFIDRPISLRADPLFSQQNTISHSHDRASNQKALAQSKTGTQSAVTARCVVLVFLGQPGGIF